MKERYDKKSQIAVFVIIAILIVFVVVGIFFLDNRSSKRSLVSPDIVPIDNLVRGCIRSVFEEGVYHIGDTGGYFEPNELSNEKFIAYYLYEGENKMPLKEDIEKELEKYIDTMLFFCVEGFEGLNGFGIKQGVVKSDVKISDDFIDIEVDYPLSIKKGDNSFFIDNFNEKVNIRLGRMINAISEMMIIQMEETRYVCINCNDKIAEENSLLIDLETYDGSEITFNIIDTKSEVKGGAYWFRFVNKYE